MIKRNVLANMLGGGWGMILGFLLVPVQIRILSVEAYGLLAFLASVQIIFNVFDLGLSPAITREVAGDKSPDLAHSRDLVQSLALVYSGIGVVLSLALAMAAPWIATDWLKLEGLSTETARLALQLGALAILIRWPVTFFGGVIAGRQRFDLLNLLGAGLATVILVVSIAVVWLTHSLIALLIWRVMGAAIELALVVVLCFHLLPGLSLRLKAPMAAVRHVWRFAGGMNALSIQGLIVTQGDRFLISRILPISALGYYAVAYGMAQTLSTMQGTISSVMFPAFTATFVRDDRELLAVQCAKAAQFVTFVIAFPAFLLVFFGYDILRLWINRETAQAAYIVLGILALAFLLNAPLNILSTMSVATAHIRTLLLINGVGVIAYLPILVFLTMRYALVGAALTFLFLQVYYLAIFPRLALHILDQGRPAAWLARNALPFALVGLATVGSAKAIAVGAGLDTLMTLLLLVVAGLVYLAAAFPALHRDLRRLGAGHLTQAYWSIRRLIGPRTQTGA
jgi:O-antigen/teichoic acid export membrane protein